MLQDQSYSPNLTGPVLQVQCCSPSVTSQVLRALIKNARRVFAESGYVGALHSLKVYAPVTFTNLIFARLLRIVARKRNLPLTISLPARYNMA